MASVWSAISGSPSPTSADSCFSWHIDPTGAGDSRRLGFAGRMALTNYALQCVAIEWLSSPFGLNLKLRPYYYALGAVLLFVLEVALSGEWLSRFRFGPLEWIWRSLTYMRWQPMR